MDAADHASKQQELAMRANLHKSRRDEPGVVATGECLFCGEPLPKNRRWCDAQCRDDWELENE